MSASSYCRFYSKTKLRENLNRRSVKGGMHALFGQGCMFFIQLLSTAFLARLLAPEQFGLIAMVMSITTFANLFKDMGLTTAVIQRDEVTHAEISTLFWVNVVFGLILTVTVFAVAPFVSGFYGSVELIPVTRALSVIFLISGFIVIPQSLLRRQMMLGKVALILIASRLLSCLVAIVAAFYWRSYWALVLMHITFPIFEVIGVFLLTRWLPGRIGTLKEITSYLSFGAGIAGFNISNYFSRNLDKILIGKYYGSSILGAYSKAYQLLMLPINQVRAPIMNIGIPALSALRDEPERYRNYYRSMLFVIAGLSMPLVAILFCCAREVILLLMGEQWLYAVELFQIFALVGILQPVATASRGPVMISLGLGKRYFIYGLVNAVITSGSYFLGIKWGAEGVALAHVITYTLFLCVSIRWCLYGSPVRSRDFFGSLLVPALATFIGVLVMFSLKPSLLETTACLGTYVSMLLTCIVLGMLNCIICLGIYALSPIGRKYLTMILNKTSGKKA